MLPEGWGNESPPAVATLRPYDNVNDYVSAPNTNTSAFNNGKNGLVDALGRPMNLEGYSATVSIAPDKLGDIAAGTGADSDALRIRIIVTYAGDDPVTLDGFRARYAPVPGIE